MGILDKDKTIKESRVFEILGDKKLYESGLELRKKLSEFYKEVDYPAERCLILVSLAGLTYCVFLDESSDMLITGYPTDYYRDFNHFLCVLKKDGNKHNDAFYEVTKLASRTSPFKIHAFKVDFNIKDIMSYMMQLHYKVERINTFMTRRPVRSVLDL